MADKLNDPKKRGPAPIYPSEPVRPRTRSMGAALEVEPVRKKQKRSYRRHDASADSTDRDRPERRATKRKKKTITMPKTYPRGKTRRPARTQSRPLESDDETLDEDENPQTQRVAMEAAATDDTTQLEGESFLDETEDDPFSDDASSKPPPFIPTPADPLRGELLPSPLEPPKEKDGGKASEAYPKALLGRPLMKPLDDDHPPADATSNFLPDIYSSAKPSPMAALAALSGTMSGSGAADDREQPQEDPSLPPLQPTDRPAPKTVLDRMSFSVTPQSQLSNIPYPSFNTYPRPGFFDMDPQPALGPSPHRPFGLPSAPKPMLPTYRTERPTEPSLSPLPTPFATAPRHTTQAKETSSHTATPHRQTADAKSTSKTDGLRFLPPVRQAAQATRSQSQPAPSQLPQQQTTPRGFLDDSPKPLADAGISRDFFMPLSRAQKPFETPPRPFPPPSSMVSLPSTSLGASPTSLAQPSAAPTISNPPSPPPAPPFVIAFGSDGLSVDVFQELTVDDSWSVSESDDNAPPFLEPVRVVEPTIDNLVFSTQSTQPTRSLRATIHLLDDSEDDDDIKTIPLPSSAPPPHPPVEFKAHPHIPPARLVDCDSDMSDSVILPTDFHLTPPSPLVSTSTIPQQPSTQTDLPPPRRSSGRLKTRRKPVDRANSLILDSPPHRVPRSRKRKREEEEFLALSSQISTAIDPNESLTEEMKICAGLISTMIDQQQAEPFKTEVDPILLNVLDYFTVIDHPMDLETIMNKVKKQRYADKEEFAHDVRLVFHNAMKYNAEDNQIHQNAKTMLHNFERNFKVAFTKNRRRYLKAYLDSIKTTDNGQFTLPVLVEPKFVFDGLYYEDQAEIDAFEEKLLALQQKPPPERRLTAWEKERIAQQIMKMSSKQITALLECLKIKPAPGVSVTLDLNTLDEQTIKIVREFATNVRD